MEELKEIVVNVISEMGHSWITAIDGVDALQKMERINSMPSSQI